MSQDSPAPRPPALRRWLVLAAIVISAAAVFALDRLPRGPIAGPPASAASLASNPMPTQPPDPTLDPDSVAVCAVDDLALSAGGWGGATGSMAGGATVINVSSDRCRVAGKPGLELRAKRGAAIATGSAPADGEPIVLAPGGVTSVITVWRNWCADRPAPPLSLHLELFGIDGTLDATVTDWENAGPDGSSVPRCDLASAPSTVDAPLPFAAPEPPEPGAGTLDAPCTRADATAYLGSWGAAAGTSYASVIVFNRAGVGCLLDGSPNLELRDADGNLVSHRGNAVDASPVDLPAGRAAQTYVGFTDWCLARPALPFELYVIVAGERLPIKTTSEGSAIGVPACQSDPPAPAPLLFLNDPFSLPDS